MAVAFGGGFAASDGTPTRMLREQTLGRLGQEWATAGVQLFYLSRIMGTSVTQIDATYGHLVPDSEEFLRGLLDGYDATKTSEARAEGSP